MEKVSFWNNAAQGAGATQQKECLAHRNRSELRVGGKGSNAVRVDLINTVLLLCIKKALKLHSASPTGLSKWMNPSGKRALIPLPVPCLRNRNNSQLAEV